MSFSLNFTLPANTVGTAAPAYQTSSPVVTDGKGTDCGPSLGLAAGIPSLAAMALLVALLFILIHRRRSSSESTEESEKPCEITEIYDSPRIAENPRRLPTQEKNMMGGEEAHIYVKTVSGSEESMRDTYRPAVEVERRRGLWWLIPQTEPGVKRRAKQQGWSWERAEHTGIDRARSEQRSQAAA